MPIRSGNTNFLRRDFLKSAMASAVAYIGAATLLGCAKDREGLEIGLTQVGLSSDELYKFDATAQAELVRKGEISRLELVEAAIHRIEALNKKLNFLAGHDFDRARKAALSLTSDAPFSGVPILLKDTLSYPGLRYSIGSRLFANQIAKVGSEYTSRIDEAGFITVGKSTTSEFALLGSVETWLEGITRNPWNLERSPAGSSGGSAAAVAAGAIPIAHASDGGGSIRIPASATGLFGLKPSRGRTVPDMPDGSETTRGIVSQHCLTRTVRDSAGFLSVTERKGPDAILPEVGYVDTPIRTRLKIAFYTETLLGDEPEPEVRQAIEKTARLCEDLGHEVVTSGPPPVDGDEIGEAFFTIAGHGMSELEKRMGQALGRRIDETLMEPFALGMIDWYRHRPEGSLSRALDSLKKGSLIIEDFFSKYDVSLCPTLPVTPRPIGHFSQEFYYEETMDRLRRFAGYTPIHNQAGVPGMSVPLWETPSGLPVGSHFATRIGGEALLLGLAYELEESQPWAERWPDIAHTL